MERRSGAGWLVVGLLLATLGAVALTPLADCPECRAFPWDDPGLPGRPITGALPAHCPLCGGREKTTFWRAWSR